MQADSCNDQRWLAKCRGRGRKKGAAEAMLTWDWGDQRARVAKALSGVAEVDLMRLWRPASVAGPFLQRWMETVRSAIN